MWDDGGSGLRRDMGVIPSVSGANERSVQACPTKEVKDSVTFIKALSSEKWENMEIWKCPEIHAPRFAVFRVVMPALGSLQ
jgi:hypothetical protein